MFPEPQTIQEYQAELLRAWGALARLDDRTREAEISLIEVSNALQEGIAKLRAARRVLERIKNPESQ